MGVIGALPLFLIAFIIVGAVIFALYVLLAPMAAIVFALVVPFLPTLFFGAPLSSAWPLVLYEAIIIGLLFALKKRKSVEISKW